jgi:hypothetical protein
VKLTREYRAYLRDEYLIKGRSTTQIAADCGVHATTIMRHLEAARIPRRRRGPRSEVTNGGAG